VPQRPERAVRTQQAHHAIRQISGH